MKKICMPVLILAVAAFMGSCGNDNSQTGPASSATAAAKESGESIYKRTCVACHQANAEGLATSFPPLAKSDYLADKEKVISQAIKGSSGDIVVNGKKYNNTMPPQQLSDDEIAAVLTYVYNNFGNPGGTITAGDVKAIRAKL